MKRALSIIVALLGALALYLVVGRVTSPEGASEAAPVRSESGVDGDPRADTAAPAAAEQANAPRVALALEGEGLRLFDTETGSARPIPFGTAAAVTREMVAASGSGAVVEEGESVECNVDFARLENGLTIWLRQERFVGWSLRDPDGALTTAGGIGIGSTRAELESVHDARIFDSSLGVEFAAGALAGLLESDDPDGRVSNLWAGETCIAR